MAAGDLADSQYRALAEVRYRIRRFLNFSERAARAAGVEPQQHQLLLVLRGLRPPQRPTIRTAAERLQIRHNSAVELVERSVERGLVVRRRNTGDRREVSLQLTARGRRVLRRLSVAHRSELRSAGPALAAAMGALAGSRRGGKA